jgi:undecaprenol kinase
VCEDIAINSRRELEEKLERDLKSRQSFTPSSWRNKSGRSSSFIESFYHACNGITLAFRQERNVRIHSFCAVLAIMAGIFFRLSTLEWVSICFCIGLVIATELINTSLEHLVNLSSGQEYHLFARYAKDTAAGAVLVVSWMSLIVGLIIFVPKLVLLFS